MQVTEMLKTIASVNHTHADCRMILLMIAPAGADELDQLIADIGE